MLMLAIAYVWQNLLAEETKEKVCDIIPDVIRNRVPCLRQGAREHQD